MRWNRPMYFWASAVSSQSSGQDELAPLQLIHQLCMSVPDWGGKLSVGCSQAENNNSSCCPAVPKLN